MAGVKPMAGELQYRGKLAIFTTFYNYMAFAPYIRSLATTLGVLSELGIAHEYLMQPADFHVERAVNNILNDLCDGDDFTDVLFIDSDETWEPDGVLRLLSHREDMVGATYRMKNRWHDYVGHVLYEDGMPLGRTLGDGTPLLQADRVAGGFLRMKVSGLRRFRDHYPDLTIEEGGKRKTQFFTRIVRDGVVHDQDMSFCRLWLEMGETLWIDPMIKVDHWGFEKHAGDFEAHLRAIHSPPPIDEAMANIIEFAKKVA